MSQLNVGTVNTTVGLQLPAYNTVDLPSENISTGFLAYDNTSKEVKYYDGTNWRSLTDVGSVSASGGTKYKFGQYTIHKFEDSGTFTISNATEGKTMEVFLVGGGGGGGAADGNCSNGGGGGGGLILASVEMTKGTYPVIVGRGGIGYQNTDRTGDDGGNSTAFGLTALGGGGGGGGGAVNSGNGSSGGSGGGGGHPWSGPRSSGLQPGSASGGFGNAGGSASNAAPQWGGGGGGGAGSAGTDGTSTLGGPGGDGLLYDIDGVPKYYAGGGAGALCGNSGMINGGLGGGGNSGSFNTTSSSSGPGFNGGMGLGGGGGGAGYNPSYRSKAGDGGDGIVVIRYVGDSILDPTIGLSQENPAQNALHVLAENPTAENGLYWIKPSGYAGVAQQVWCDMSSGWMLVASSNAASTVLPSGTSRNSSSYFLNRSGQLGNPDPNDDYIIGSMITALNFQKARVFAFGRGSTNGTYSYTNPGTTVEAIWTLNGGGSDRLVDIQTRSRVTISGSLSPNANYFVLDGVQRDSLGDGTFNANANQSTVGGVGVQGQYGDPNSGCYLGHGTSEGSFEGWYDAGNASANCQGYTTWVS